MDAVERAYAVLQYAVKRCNRAFQGDDRAVQDFWISAMAEAHTAYCMALYRQKRGVCATF